MDDQDSKNHHNKSFENVHDLSESSSINSNQERHLQCSECQNYSSLKV